ncbi:ABC transporter permease [Ruegeria sp. 2012CJ41-6]|uniref:ABC transporter permease n=1 Tax=Ruegeria spongiae TaxID=2942209 RepID=A0ABT0Q2R3_9RHOB|nr:ABC transporter permease [Ruegeria spongiae]MCL6284159.1 ABC transporter permease [Ruegeria spongiae]
MLFALILLSLVEPRFLRQANLINVLRGTGFLVLIACGQMLVLIVGGFDLSVGAVVALSSVVSALTMAGLGADGAMSVWTIIAFGFAAGIGAGLVVGLLNGLCVTYLKVSPFMVTLGTMSIAAGVALYISAGAPVYGLPEEFTRIFGRYRFADLPIIVYTAAAAAAVLWLMMNKTVFGLYVYAIGGDPAAARNSGVSASAVLISCYAICGMLAGLTGLLLTARIGSGEATLGSTLMLESIAASVIGGVSLRGGVGRVENVVLGALILVLVTNAMNLMRVDSKIQTIVIGIVLILAVAVDAWRQRIRGRRAA